MNEPYSKCDTKPYIDANHKIVNNRINCEFDCKAKFLFGKCGCLPPDAERLIRTIHNSSRRNCSIYEQIVCIKAAYLSFERGYRKKHCQCAESCKRSYFEARKVQYGYRWENRQPKPENVVSFMIDLDLYEEVQQERPEYSLPEFLSDIGGTFGLFLGISIASAVVQVISIFSIN